MMSNKERNKFHELEAKNKMLIKSLKEKDETFVEIVQKTLMNSLSEEVNDACVDILEEYTRREIEEEV